MFADNVYCKLCTHNAAAAVSKRVVTERKVYVCTFFWRRALSHYANNLSCIPLSRTTSSSFSNSCECREDVVMCRPRVRARVARACVR